MWNIYYSPEAYGLTVVGEIEMYDGGYGFDTIVLWRNEAGRFFWAQDSGCSCPSPFEEHNMSTLSTGDLKEFYSFCKTLFKEHGQEDQIRFTNKLQDIVWQARDAQRQPNGQGN